MSERPPHGLPAAQGLNSQTFTAVSSSKTSRLCPSLCALQPTPQPVSAVAGLSWCASSQPRRLGARALFHAVHARASCCPLVSDAQSMWRDVKAKCLADKKNQTNHFPSWASSKITTYDSCRTGSKMFFLGQIGLGWVRGQSKVALKKKGALFGHSSC